MKSATRIGVNITSRWQGHDKRARFAVDRLLSVETSMTQVSQVAWFEELGRGDLPLVGGKNASLGEMVQALDRQGVRVPPGFATTAPAYSRYLEANGLRPTIAAALNEFAAGKASLAETSAAIRRSILRGDWPPDTAEAIRSAYEELCRRAGKSDVDVAVRSSVKQRVAKAESRSRSAKAS